MRVAIADDSVLFREGLARVLADAGFTVTATVGTADDLHAHVDSHRPDVAIVDIRMPPTHTDEGLRAAQRIRARQTSTAVLVLSQYVEPHYALQLLGSGATSVVTCSRTTSSTWPSSPTRSAGWATANS
jgi:DNA-binding NarL/FixJ family response regulator